MGGMLCGQRGVEPVGKVLRDSELTGPPKPRLCSQASKYLVVTCGLSEGWIHSGKEADLSEQHDLQMHCTTSQQLLKWVLLGISLDFLVA